MSTYKGRVALVTGASSGIGAAIAEDLVKAGLIVVGAARRVERIQALSDHLKGEPGRLVARKLDVSKENEIKEIFEWIETELGGVDVLINNAAVLILKPIHEQTAEEVKRLVTTNQVSVALAAGEAINSWVRRNINDGYIINISSVFGHYAPHTPGFSVGLYPATKFALRGTSLALRSDIKNAGRKIRVTNISPGVVLTELYPRTAGAEIIQDNYLSAEEVAKTVTFVLSMPKTSEITELTIRPTGECF